MATGTEQGERISQRPEWSEFVTLRGERHLLDMGDDCELSGRVEISGRNNRLTMGRGSALKAYAPAGFAATVPDMGRRSNASLSIDGDDNVVVIEEGAQLAANIAVRGDGNRILIARACHLHGFMNVITCGGRLEIGAGTTMVQGSIQLHEPVAITIGADCMISSQVYISASDIHPIHDRSTGSRINRGRSVEIGDHVWLGLRTLVMKGARIGTGSVVAAGALVSGHVEDHVVVGGSPARVLRKNVRWARDFADDDRQPTTPEPTPRRWRLFGR